ncbi:MAG: hypothetical protein AAGK37_19535 [Pseudomonadota bacterium]
MQGYDRIFDLLVELSDRCERDGLSVTSQRLELALDALLAETHRRPVRPMAPAPIPARSPWRAAERKGAKRRVLGG